jgi:ABC-type phosphate/phosphonate transport system permease subunit
VPHERFWVLRAVPDLMWGLLFVGSGLDLVQWRARLPLAVSYSGVLGRVYADVFEDVDPRASRPYMVWAPLAFRFSCAQFGHKLYQA